jgi:hypothetical protein
MPALPLRPLSLPEEFALLSLAESGKMIDSGQVVVGCAAAELGELALRRKLLVRSRKFTIFGLDGYRPHPAEIQLLDTSPTGLVWADQLLDELRRRDAAEVGRVIVWPWLRQRRAAFALHRDALTARGVLRHQPRRHSGPFRAFGRDRYYPDPVVRSELIAAVRAACTGPSQLDEHMLFLSDLVDSSQLYKDLGFTIRVQSMLDRNRGRGTFPQDLRDTSALLAFWVPKRSRHQD